MIITRDMILAGSGTGTNRFLRERLEQIVDELTALPPQETLLGEHAKVVAASWPEDPKDANDPHNESIFDLVCKTKRYVVKTGPDCYETFGIGMGSL